MGHVSRAHGLSVAALLAMVVGCAPLLPAAGQPGEASLPGEIQVRATYEHLGVRWPIEGDADRDGRVTLRYRVQGAAEWRQALPPVRTHTDLVGEGNDRPDNRWAGSVFWLTPGRTYEMELSLTDPDGGSTTRLVTGTTRIPMTAAPDARVRLVVPGEGGGIGTPEDPFRGIQAAADAAEPGDLFGVGPGRYRPFQLLESGEPGRPIVFRGPDGRTAVVDGGGTDRGIVTLGEYNRPISHVMVERLVLENGRWGIDAQHSRDITVRHLVVRDVDDGYVNRRGDGREANQTVCDSAFYGRRGWPGEGIPPERAVDVRGDGNVVCHNFITGFGDGASLQPFTGPSWGNDVYGNDITHIVDDPIEIDYNQANVRVWGNRVTNGRMGISLAPSYGGPAYVFRNVFFNVESSAYKMNREPAGLVIAHNTSLKRGNGTSSPRNWQNTWLRNNFLFGTRYIFEEYGLAPGSVDDWDYDALAREPECGGDMPPCFKWNNVRYGTLDDLRAGVGIETHGVVGGRDDLMNAPLPNAYETPVPPDGYDLRLRPGVPEANAGDVIPNLNDPWVTDGRPDIGAYEWGAPLPHYGPRPIGAPLTFLPSGPPPTATATPTEPPLPSVTPTPTVAAGVSTATPTQTVEPPWARMYLPHLSTGS